MKKLFFIFLFYFVFSNFFFAESTSEKTNWNLSISPVAGITLGKIEKHLYSYNDSDAQVSYLNWEQMPLYNFGFDAEYSYKAIKLHLAFDYALPLRCGHMYDSDWNNTTGVQTTYSVSENTSSCNIYTLFGINYDFPINKIFVITPKLEAQYTYDGFAARNAYGWYGSAKWSSTGEEVAWNDPAAHYFPDGKYHIAGADYFRHTLYTFTGCKLSFNITPSFSAAIAFMFSPFTFTHSLDHHLSKTGGTWYREIQFGYLDRYKLETCFNYNINKKLTIYMKGAFVWGIITKGYLFAGSEKDDMAYSQQAIGSNILQLKVTTGVTFYINK